MKANTYFKKYGEIYGIEEPFNHCGYATEIIRFTDFEKATTWKNEDVQVFRYLGTKTDVLHAPLRAKESE